MKLAILFATAIYTIVLAAEEQHLDVRPCACSSATSSCHCQGAEKSVQILLDVVPKCGASHDLESGKIAPYPDDTCGVARRYADVVCIASKNPEEPFSGEWCGSAQKRADSECSPTRRRSAEEASEETQLADACATAQKGAIACIVSRNPEDPFTGDWCSSAIDAVHESCGITATKHKRTDYPPDWCGRRRIDCITARTPEDPFPGDWCGGVMRLVRDCLVSRSPEGDFPGDWCGKRDEHCRVSRRAEKAPSAWCSSIQKRADHCRVSRGWEGYVTSAKREPTTSAEDACDYSSRGGRRAVTPPHCMCPVESDEAAGADAVRRCRCGGEETRKVATEYHCMCLTGEGNATAPCACTGDVAFLSEVEYEQ
ncbi:hypothetical protein ISF_06299 [Cordyceps fumosorosea ARSEF 2679]|uniref:Uncharacterized protein n=1 Tax=Cordyceps fumosorosea (strain ARSEF 2679) TaxID=1081104 RepID=A0A167S8G7_CORFA|nr:hypothetical protein ISF_06299 [Cordyceps fumosorosea ARSEF 2679]OAA59364.1 hypothetical protein ISF_06299 [Cordyceps fumosorosea ARSEF 2679]